MLNPIRFFGNLLVNGIRFFTVKPSRSEQKILHISRCLKKDFEVAHKKISERPDSFFYDYISKNDELNKAIFDVEATSLLKIKKIRKSPKKN